jgi:hypothetical protein
MEARRRRTGGKNGQLIKGSKIVKKVLKIQKAKEKHASK